MGCINSLSHSGIFTRAPHRIGKCQAKDGPYLYNVQVGGEGWHNRHHARPKCAKNGPAGWTLVDYNYSVICVLEALHLVWNVKHPNRDPKDAHQEESPQSKQE